MNSGVRREAMSRLDPAVGGTSTGLHLSIDRARHFVARQQLRRATTGAWSSYHLSPLLRSRSRRGTFGDVVEHEAFAFGVAQHSASLERPR